MDEGTPRRLLIAALAAWGLVNVAVAARSVGPDVVQHKDFVQEWLLARAALTGLDPYTPLPALGERFLGPGHAPLFPQPTPHPPPVMLVVAPLGALPLTWAAAVWLVVELAAFVWVAARLLRWCGVRSPAAIAVATAAACAWYPAATELVVGQLGGLLLVALCLAWEGLRDGRDLRGGVALGVAIGLKFMGWPLVPWLLWRRRFAAALAAVVTAAALNLATLPVLGVAGLVGYYTEVSKLGAALYRAYASNFSPYSLGWRLLEGTGSDVLVGVRAAPLVDAPALAGPVAAVALLGWAAAAVVVATRARDDAALVALLAASTVSNPIAWHHYLLPVVFAFVWAWREGRVTPGLVAGAILVSLPRELLHDAMMATSRDGVAPIAATGLGLLPLVGVAAITLAVTRRAQPLPQ